MVNTPGEPVVTDTGSAGRAFVVPDEKSTEPEASLARTRVTPFGSAAVPTSGNAVFWKVPRAGEVIVGAGLVRDSRNPTVVGAAVVLPGESVALMAIWYEPSGRFRPAELRSMDHDQLVAPAGLPMLAALATTFQDEVPAFQTFRV